MMASRKSEAATQRPKKKSTKQFGMTQFLLVGIGVVAVIVIAVLLFGGSGKKTAAPRAQGAAADTGSTYGKARKLPAVAVHRVKAAHDSLIAKRREERLKREQEVKASGGRTTRSASGGYVSGGATHVASTPNQLRAILTDNSGSRTALVGERRLKAGDDVEGHKIVEVSGDGIKVEYRQSTYSVRVGEKIY
jgi:hypothetical protein